MALSADTNRVYEVNESKLHDDVPLGATDQVYAGSAVGEDASTGYGRALVSGDTFLGFAIVGRTGGTNDGDVNARVVTKGKVKLDVATATVASLGATVNATDDGTFTLAAGSAIGKVTRFVSGTTCIVRFEADGARSI